MDWNIEIEEKSEHSKSPFNTPIESGLRSLYLLNAIAPQQCDLQRLVYYDYLLVHSSDVPNGPQSLHPSTPHRSGELLVRRQIIANGLDLMFSRELIEKEFTSEGIFYKSTELTELFLKYLKSDYATALKKLAKWVATTFIDYSDVNLHKYITQNLGRWGAEFKQEALIREVPK